MGICQSPAPRPRPPDPPFVRIENIVISLDDGEDELLLPMVGKDYSPAEPPMRQDFKPPVKWYNDDDDDYKPEEDVFGSRTSLQETERRLTGEQHVSGLSLADIDAHAKRAKKQDANSFDSLLDYLTSPITQTNNQELFTARALIVWLANQDIDGKTHGTATSTTPNGYLQMQKEKKATFASFFAALCRYAGIQCTLIHGICKGGNYQPGDTEVQECIWVAVRVEGTWQIIHPYWVCRTMVGQKLGGWIKLEADGKTVSRTETSTQGMIQTAFKETYFMPKPKDFKYICYPDESEWQLLPTEAVVKSKADFLRLPFILPAFFGLRLNLLTLHSCEYDSKNGIVDIVIKCRKSQAFKTVMAYDLFLRDTVNSGDERLNVGNLPRLVLNSRSEERFSFQIRFPVEGTFKIVFYAGVYGKPLLRVCEFKLNCAKRLANCQLLPINTGIDGWGPGPAAERAGLLLPSHMGGVISLQPPPANPKAKPEEFENSTNIKFALNQDMMKSMEYSAVMVGGKTMEDAAALKELNRNVECKVDKVNKELNIDAKIPEEGEYALVIRAGKKDKPKRSVCNYLLTTLKTFREGVPQRKARKALKAAMADSNLEELQEMIGKCGKAKLDDNDDDLRAAKQRQTLLIVKSHLLDCHKRRNMDVTKRTLAEVSKYRHKLALMVETRRVEKLKEQLEKLGGFTREVPQLKQACEELIFTTNPNREILSTMKALFILLDEPIDQLDDWRYIQSLLKHSEQTTHVNVLNRMKGISERVIDAKTRRKISTTLHTYSETQVRHSSQAAASFYRWIDGVLVAFSGEKTESDIQTDLPLDKE